jgi:hypothetical protein
MASFCSHFSYNRSLLENDLDRQERRRGTSYRPRDKSSLRGNGLSKYLQHLVGTNELAGVEKDLPGLCGPKEERMDRSRNAVNF